MREPTRSIWNARFVDALLEQGPRQLAAVEEM